MAAPSNFFFFLVVNQTNLEGILGNFKLSKLPTFPQVESNCSRNAGLPPRPSPVLISTQETSQTWGSDSTLFRGLSPGLKGDPWVLSCNEGWQYVRPNLSFLLKKSRATSLRKPFLEDNLITTLFKVLSSDRRKKMFATSNPAANIPATRLTTV
jgi:hypothetical protein